MGQDVKEDNLPIVQSSANRLALLDYLTIRSRLRLSMGF